MIARKIQEEVDDKTKVKKESGGTNIIIEPVDSDSQSDGPSDSKKPRLDNGNKSQETDIKGKQ